MARLVLAVLALAFITCVVADYDSNERENHGVRIGKGDKVLNEETTTEVILPSRRIKNNENRTEVTLPSGKTAYIENYECLVRILIANLLEASTLSRRLILLELLKCSHEQRFDRPTGKEADKMKESSQCGSETILLELEPNDVEYKLIRHSTFSKYNITKIERVINGCLMKRYKIRQEQIVSQSDNLNERMLFYGTLHADDIVANGFDERYTDTSLSGMFGAGIYFSEHSSTSNQYTSNPMDRDCMTCERKMIFSRVTLGNIYKLPSAEPQWAHAPVGYHSVQGAPSTERLGLKEGEYVIYRGDQAYPDYVITYNLTF